MREAGESHPKVHTLSHLALLLRDGWSASDRALLITLSDFAVAARYDDPAWAERLATAENAELWLRRTSDFLSAQDL